MTRSVTILLAIQVLCVSCKGPCQQYRRTFDQYLKGEKSTVPNRPVRLIDVGECDKTALPPLISLSSNAEFLAVLLPNSRRPENSLLWVVSTRDATQLAEIHTIHSKDLLIMPAGLIWGPLDSELLVFMKYADVEYGEWIHFDLRVGGFIGDSKKRLDEMLRYDSSYRPDTMLTARSIWTPVWDYSGARYESMAHANNAGVDRFWEAPSFRGNIRTSINLEKQSFEVLISESLLATKPVIARGYVISNGSFVRQIELATRSVPPGTLLFYQNKKLVILGGFVTSRFNLPTWRAELPGSQLDDMLVCQINGELRIVLLTLSGGLYKVFLAIGQ